MYDLKKPKTRDYSIRGYIERLTTKELTHIIHSYAQGDHSENRTQYIDTIIDVLQTRCTINKQESAIFEKRDR